MQTVGNLLLLKVSGSKSANWGYRAVKSKDNEIIEVHFDWLNFYINFERHSKRIYSIERTCDQFVNGLCALLVADTVGFVAEFSIP